MKEELRVKIQIIPILNFNTHSKFFETFYFNSKHFIERKEEVSSNSSLPPIPSLAKTYVPPNQSLPNHPNQIYFHE